MHGKPDAKVTLPPIPAKRYFTIGEVSDLCGVKPHVLRYWEQEFTQLRPMKRRGNRRYYQHHEVLLVRRIRELLYEEGFTINGARNRLTEIGGARGRAAMIGVGDIEGDATSPLTGAATRGKGQDAVDGGNVVVPALTAVAVAVAPSAHSPQQSLALGAEPLGRSRSVREALLQALELLR